MQHAGELISLFLTPLTIIASLVVLVVWGKEARKDIWHWKAFTAREWFIVGVALSFLAGTLDNTYWAIPWSLSYIESDAAEGFFSAGVFFNIPNRQTLTLAAALCHIRAADMRMEPESKPLTGRVVRAGVLTGLGYVVALQFAKGL